jgi:hypothetical protein
METPGQMGNIHEQIDNAIADCKTRVLKWLGNFIFPDSTAIAPCR